MRDERGAGLWDARVRPASVAHAESAYPEVVDGLLHGRYTLTTSPPNLERRLVMLTGTSLSASVVMVREDYDILQSIAASLEPIPAFLSEPRDVFLQRVKAIVRVRFAGRGAF